RASARVEQRPEAIQIVRGRGSRDPGATEHRMPETELARLLVGQLTNAIAVGLRRIVEGGRKTTGLGIRCRKRVSSGRSTPRAAREPDHPAKKQPSRAHHG